MKHLTILAVIAALALPLTAYADEAWDAECEGRPIQSVQNDANAISGSEFMEKGIVEYNGREEKWYSSQVLYHYRTPEWTADDEGFYRTDEGYYVIATDAFEEGTIVQTSRGMAQVLDCGCGDVIDFYVRW